MTARLSELEALFFPGLSAPFGLRGRAAPGQLRRLPLAACLALALAGASCQRTEPCPDCEESEPEPEEVARVEALGQETAGALMQSLGGQLTAAMQAGGPVEAMAVCQSVAQPLTAATGAGIEGAEVRRTTLRPRNPLNAPDETDREVLEAMEALSTEGAAPDPVVHWEAETARYYAPVMIQEVCLTCHGDRATFPEPLAERLGELYPDDEATGYALGDFRGAIRVDVARDPAP